MILGILTKLLTGGVLDKVLDAYKAYKGGEISRAEYESRAKVALEESAAKIEQSWADATAKVAASTQDTLKAAPLLQRAWAAVLFLQVAALFWYQVGAPAFQLATGVEWPNPGISLDWCYALIMAMIGAGPLVLRR